MAAPPSRRIARLLPFAQALKAVRTDRGIRQQTVADVMKISVPTLQRIERAEADPRITQVLDLCALLGVEPQDLLRGVVTDRPGTMPDEIESLREEIAQLQARIEESEHTTELVKLLLDRVRALEEREAERAPDPPTGGGEEGRDPSTT